METPGDQGPRIRRCCFASMPDDGVLSLFSLPARPQGRDPQLRDGRLNEPTTVGGVKKTLDTVRDLTGLRSPRGQRPTSSGSHEAGKRSTRLLGHRPQVPPQQRGPLRDQQYARSTSTSGIPATLRSRRARYVRYRHRTTTFVRAARQQDFLSEARQKSSRPDSSSTQGQHLIDIFTKYNEFRRDEAGPGDTRSSGVHRRRDVPISAVSFEGNSPTSTRTGRPGPPARSRSRRRRRFLNGATLRGPRAVVRTRTRSGGDDGKTADGKTEKKGTPPRARGDEADH